MGHTVTPYSFHYEVFFPSIGGEIARVEDRYEVGGIRAKGVKFIENQ